jgi:hypothetical protein
MLYHLRSFLRHVGLFLYQVRRILVHVHLAGSVLVEGVPNLDRFLCALSCSRTVLLSENVVCVASQFQFLFCVCAVRPSLPRGFKFVIHLHFFSPSFQKCEGIESHAFGKD